MSHEEKRISLVLGNHEYRLTREELQTALAKSGTNDLPVEATRAQWLAGAMVEWSRSEYPRLFPPEWRHASLIGWLMNEALLTPEQAREVFEALGSK